MTGQPNVHIISASAGSGKTTRLAQLLEQAIGDGSARADAILATTFTNKAAAELQQRVRTTLLSAGRVDQAQQLAASRIGTVNSVCGRLVSDFAFELGLSPELKVLDEVAARVAFKRALTGVVTDDETQTLAELKDRMVAFDWQASVATLVDQARANCIPPEALTDHAERSVQGMKALFGPALPDGDALDRAFAKALRTFIDAVRAGPDKTKGTATAVEKAEDALRTIRVKGWATWHQWLFFAQTLETGKTSRALAEALKVVARDQDNHPRLHSDCEQAIRLCFDLARRALAAYAKYKAEWAAIDFVDQEVLALELLGRPDVQARLGDQLDLVLVDEFQDTSPLQLSIFLKLAHLAKRSVWVGDQKQSIFAFRGTDPALMDAALQQLLGNTRPETLDFSRRSRPSLVDRASDVFVKAFAQHGMPEDWVRLKHPDGQEPEGLGPVFEYHRLNTKNEPADLVAIADGVAQLLADPTVRVRDRATGEVRALRPGDVAVLAKDNQQCDGVAEALASRGIDAVVPRTGLLATPEGQVVLAGLELLADPHDSLAAATLARILEYPDQPDAFLTTAIHQRRASAQLQAQVQVLFGDQAFAQRLAAARDEAARSGPLSAFDAVLTALALPERCAAWGQSAQRLANLDALRAHAVAYVQQALDGGGACTPAGLVEALRELEAAEEDTQATVSGDANSVVVSTWHRAKGLEWPVVLLYGQTRDAFALGIHVDTTAPTVDINDPLKGRWIRYWPRPYHDSQSKGPFFDRLGDTPEQQVAARRGREQELRLLYVGWTRARDRLVLTGRGASLAYGMNALLTDGDPEGPSPLLGKFDEVSPDGVADVAIAGVPTSVRIREAQATEGAWTAPVPGEFYPPRAPGTWPEAFVTPSSQEGLARVHSVTELGKRLALSGDPDMQLLGEAIHTFLGSDLAARPQSEREAEAREILARWGVASSLRPEDLVAASDRLRSWAGQWPAARHHRELPIRLRQPNGTILRGSADLVLETDQAWLVVDHKSFPGSRADAEKRAATHGAQLRAYAATLRTHANKPVRGFIHLPVTGQMIELDLAERSSGTAPT